MNRANMTHGDELPRLLQDSQSTGLSPGFDARGLVEYLTNVTLADNREIERTLYNLGPGSRCIERLRISIIEEE